MIEVGPDDTPPGHDPGHSVLLVRRHRYTGELSLYRCHSTAPAALADLMAVSAQDGGSKRTSVPRSP
jgi:hypothetical protein